MSSRTLGAVVALAATAGLFFAAVSTFDFVQHLDRQVHELHCSFVPGLVEPSDGGSEGCQVTLLSPYSSIFRTSIWGGVPISLPAMAVFGFLLFRSGELWGRTGDARRSAASVLVVAWLVPLAASAVMGYLAFTKLDAACKLCIGIYISSIVGFITALLLRKAVHDETPAGPAAPSGLIWLAAAVQMALFTGLTVLVYWMTVPDYSRYIGKCGSLAHPDDPHDVMIALPGNPAGVPTIEVFDPLCPACRGFEERLRASGLEQELARAAVLFPLDDECNWMVERALHPGACRVSEAILCASNNNAVGVEAVTSWAFQHQEVLTEAAGDDPKNVTKMIEQQFPALEGCLGSTGVKSRLNKSLRWAVKNSIKVSTPQLYVAGVKLCDEDTDLGLEFTLSQLLERQRNGQLAVLSEPPAAATDGPKLIAGSTAPAKAQKTAVRTTTRPAPSKASVEATPEDDSKSAGGGLPSVADEPTSEAEQAEAQTGGVQ